MARGIGTQVRPPHHGPAAWDLGHHGRVAGAGRVARDRPAGPDQVGTAGGAVGPDRRRRGSSTAKPTVGVGPFRPRAHVPVPAVVDRYASGEPAVRPLRIDQPGRSRAARHPRRVPPELRSGRRHTVTAASFRSCAAPIAEVTIRHRRSEVALRLPQPGWRRRPLVAPSPGETELYDGIAARIRGGRPGLANPSADAAIARPAGRIEPGGRRAHAGQARVGPTWPAVRARSSPRPRSRRCSTSCGRTSRRVERCWCSPRFGRPSIRWRRWARPASPAAVYHGSLTRAGKESAIATFRDDVPILLTTESAGKDGTCSSATSW